MKTAIELMKNKNEEYVGKYMNTFENFWNKLLN
jgi:hypothetical protein